MAKKIEANSIVIERVIVHDIPKHKKDDLAKQPEYSEQESNLSDGLRVFFKDKVVQALISEKAFKICFDSENSSPVSSVMTELLASDGSPLIGHSRSMAEHLFTSQIGSNAAGILVIMFGKVNTFPTCIVLKLERDKGAQLTLDPSTRSYNIQEVKDLMLTQKTKIFKVALFIKQKDFKAKFDGLIMDYQIEIRGKKDVTTWFMDRFLGCKAFVDPRISTHRFYHYTKDYINTLPDPLDRAKYIQDLNSYIQKNSQLLSPKEFANDYFSNTQHKNGYQVFLNSKNFPMGAFPKDTSNIDKYIKKFVVVFENDISIIGSKGTFDEKVKLEKLDNGMHKAVVTSKIKTVR